MFAIIRTGGKQYRVSAGDILEVERLPVDAGSCFDFKEVLLIDDGTKTWLGNPCLPKAAVRAELLEEFKEEKVIVFKKKRRKQYKKRRGHRQMRSRVKILEIIPDLELKEKEFLEVKPSEEMRIIESGEIREAEEPTTVTAPPAMIEKEAQTTRKIRAARKKKEGEKTKVSKTWKTRERNRG